MSFYSSSSSSSESPQHQSFTASFKKKQEDDEGFRRSMNFCPFHMEARLEKLEELSGRQERHDVAKRTGEKARRQRRLRQQEKKRLKEEREEEKRLAVEREEQERWAGERAEIEELAKEKKRKWMSSPKKIGTWTDQMVWDTLADGTGELREWNGYLYLVATDGPQFLGPL
jgi:hypothetical protein